VDTQLQDLSAARQSSPHPPNAPCGAGVARCARKGVDGAPSCGHVLVGLYYSKGLNGTELTPAPESSLWVPDCRVILAAKVPEQTGSANGSDYKILMMKRFVLGRPTAVLTVAHGDNGHWLSPCFQCVRAETMKFMPG